jgi:DNA modification methylase
VKCMLILQSLQESVCIIDPCAGTHSTGVAALSYGCNYIGFDKDAAAEVACLFEFAMIHMC